MVELQLRIRMPSGPGDAVRMALSASGGRPGLVAFYVRDGFCVLVVISPRAENGPPEGATHVILVEIRQHVGANPSSTLLQCFAGGSDDLIVIDLVVADISGRWTQLLRQVSTTRVG